MTTTRPAPKPLVYCPGCLKTARCYYALAPFDLLGDDATHNRSRANLNGFNDRKGLWCAECRSHFGYDGHGNVRFVHPTVRHTQKIDLACVLAKEPTFLQMLWETVSLFPLSILYAFPGVDVGTVPGRRTVEKITIVEVVDEWTMA